MHYEPKWGYDMSLTQFHETKLALGGDTTLVITADNTNDISPIFTQLWQTIFGFEQQFSRFLPGSELSQFNTRAGLWVPISEDFKKILLTAKQLNHFTDGLYNPFILPALQKVGYIHSAATGYEADHDNDYRHRKVVPIGRLEIKGSQACIPYGTAIDLGGCGKGFLADMLADILESKGVRGYWVSLSGDMVVSGTDDAGQPWQTAVQNAFSDQDTAPVIIQSDGIRHGIATSGTLRRVNQKLSGRHHIIDPRLGKPAETDIRLATIVSELAVEADVLASCAIIVGSDSAVEYLKTRKVHAGYIQTEQSASIRFGAKVKPRNVKSYA